MSRNSGSGPWGRVKLQIIFASGDACGTAPDGPHHMKGLNMLISKIGAGIAISAALVLIAGTAQAQGGWTVVTAPPTGENAALTAVAATSDANAWAVGHSNTAPNFLGAIPVIDHWNGSAWSQVTAPSTGYSTNTLSAVSASSTSNAWAVGWSEPRRYTFYPLAMQWNGTAWSVSTSFTTAMAGQVADGVADISPTDTYAVGGGLGSAPYGIVTQWNGTTWNRLTVPVPPKDITTDFDAISADSPSDVWIVGSYTATVSSTQETFGTYTLHWNGSSWSVVSMPANAAGVENQLESVQAISPTNVWAVGQAVNSSTLASEGTLIEHWNGTSWSVVPSPSPGSNDYLNGVTANGSSDVWAVGAYLPAGSSVLQTLTLNWNGTAWSTVASPTASNGSSLTSVSTTPGAAIVQAVGYTGSNGTWNPLAIQNG
jgi:hypothetical protein